MDKWICKSPFMGKRQEMVVQYLSCQHRHDIVAKRLHEVI